MCNTKKVYFCSSSTRASLLEQFVLGKYLVLSFREHLHSQHVLNCMRVLYAVWWTVIKARTETACPLTPDVHLMSFVILFDWTSTVET